MALHEQAVGASDEWYTPPHVFAAMGARFDLDVAAPPGGIAWVPADAFISKGEDGLSMPWSGFVWMNPPFGARNGLVPWLERFFEHGNGVALVPDRTSAPWWQDYAKRADLALFVGKKLRFIRPDGSEGKSPAQGTTLLAVGQRGVAALRRAHLLGLGLILAPENLSGAQRSELSTQLRDEPLPPSGVRDETDTLSRGSET